MNIWVWKHWHKLRDAGYRSWYLDKVKAAGIAGVVIDFIASDSKEAIDFYESSLRDAARRRLMVIFHGANKPTGESRTYPNELTREGVRGLEANVFHFTLSPAYNSTIPFTRLVVGHADYTPVTFEQKFLGGTTYTHQLALPILVFSPVTHYFDTPENYLDNPATAAALDVFKAIPTVWDETIVLPGSQIGECAAFARRSGDAWFIGVLNNEQPRQLNIELFFLGRGNYRAIVLSDDMDTPTAFVRTEKTVEKKDMLTAEMRGGGGFVVMLIPDAVTEKP